MKTEKLEQNNQFEILYDDNPSENKPEIIVRYWGEDDVNKQWKKHVGDIIERIHIIMKDHNYLYKNYTFKDRFDNLEKYNDDDEVVYYQTNYIINRK